MASSGENLCTACWRRISPADFRLGQPWHWARISRKNRGIFGHGNLWERWELVGEIERMFGKSDLEIAGRTGGNRVWKFVPEILSGGWAFFWFGPLPFCQHFLPNSYALIPTNSLEFNSLHFTRNSTWGNGSTLTKSQVPKKIFRNSLHFSGQSYTNFGIIYL